MTYSADRLGCLRVDILSLRCLTLHEARVGQVDPVYLEDQEALDDQHLPQALILQMEKIFKCEDGKNSKRQINEMK